MFAHDFGHLCRGRRIHTSGHSDIGILSNLGAACSSQSGNLAITSITIAAIIRNADEPYSVKTA